MPALNWPNGKKCAVAITFDFDAETLLLAQESDNINKPGTTSQGTYGAKVGIHKILAELASASAKGTFFVPGWVADNRTAAVEAILKGGHEIGHHSYFHRRVDPADPAAEAEDIDRTIESLKRITGKHPSGYRAPFGEPSLNIMRLLGERGFTYDSSLQDDIVPYRFNVPGVRKDLIELPWQRGVADAPYIVPPRPSFTNDHILTIWKLEFEEACKSGGFLNVLMHPEAGGRPSRVLILREFLAYLQSRDDVWIATCDEIANHYKAQPVVEGGPNYTPFLTTGADGNISQVS